MTTRRGIARALMIQSVPRCQREVPGPGDRSARIGTMTSAPCSTVWGDIHQGTAIEPTSFVEHSFEGALAIIAQQGESASWQIEGATGESINWVPEGLGSRDGPATTRQERS